MGNGVHRSGWPYALAALTDWEPPILFDDFVEQTFVVQGSDLVHDIPWCGVFHYPPNMPGFCHDRMRPQWMIKSQRFRWSAPNLRLAIGLTDYLANWLSEQLGVQAGVARLPTEPPTTYWSEGAYDNNPTPMLIQVGWFLRNTRAIHQLCREQVADHVRACIWPNGSDWVNEWDERVREYWSEKRPEFPGVVSLPVCDNAEYDRLLSQNIVLMEAFDASASCVVTECIVRNTPVILNRHPAFEEYLGVGYPLFFDRFDQIPTLLTRSQVVSAHRYLCDLDKRPYGGEHFREAVISLVEDIVC
jgi:hypothetical protein